MGSVSEAIGLLGNIELRGAGKQGSMVLNRKLERDGFYPLCQN